MREPEFHSGVIDYLDLSDPRAFTTLHCVDCGGMVHAFNNECMQEWFDTGRGPLCWECLRLAVERDDARLALPDLPAPRRRFLFRRR